MENPGLSRKSAGYERVRFLAMGGPFSAKRKVSTEPGQLHFSQQTGIGKTPLLSESLTVCDRP